MDESNQHDDGEDLTWSRFWLGIGCVLAFVISSILLVIAIGGAHAGADYGLLILIVTLFAGIVDGIVLARRRRNR
jgi:O-antigen/teichoic acid export membrane protein